MKKQKKSILALVIVASHIFTLGVWGVASDDDPLISLSYIESVLMPYIDNAISTNQSQSEGFQVIELKKGQTLTALAGAEIIVRSGEAYAKIPKTALGGFTDVTAERDIADGELFGLNHLLICPRSDGRSIYADTLVYIMIRGGYEIA